MKIAILGFGTVGKGVYEMIKQAKGEALKNISVKAIFVRPGKIKTLPEMIDDINSIMNDEEISCVVEVMGGRHPAKEFMMMALSKGKHVVTANKEAVARYYTTLQNMAAENKVQFRFEASVGGGMPWLKSLLEIRRLDSIKMIYGILNGTTNYILDRMARYHDDMTVAIKQAQQLGYAELDPSTDIDAIDIRNKLVVSMILAYSVSFDPSVIPIQGIRHLRKQEMKFYQQHQLTLKLIAFAKQEQDGFDLAVEPMLFRIDDIAANVKTNENLGVARGALIGELRWIGQGAGKWPTASAILQDVIDIDENKNVCLPHALQTGAISSQAQASFWLSFPNRIAAHTVIKLLLQGRIEEEAVQQSLIFIKTKVMAVKQFYEVISMIRLQGMQVNYARIFEYSHEQEIERLQEQTKQEVAG